MRALRTVQEEILELLRRPAPPAAAPRARAAPADAWDGAGPGSQDVPVRARRRKTVLLIDDDPQTRESALRALEAAEVPVRSVLDGNAGLAAIAEQKPDVIVMELAMGGAMAGKDVVNLIKATMEWVDIPIVLWTRVAIENLREARQTHGADEYVPKASGVEALVARVISVFRRA
jgi:DNA-binding response OmpR family regulator